MHYLPSKVKRTDPAYAVYLLYLLDPGFLSAEVLVPYKHLISRKSLIAETGGKNPELPTLPKDII